MSELKEKLYIGTKVITAHPCNNEDGFAGYEVTYPDGYVSWSPKRAFEGAYRVVTEEEVQMVIAT